MKGLRLQILFGNILDSGKRELDAVQVDGGSLELALVERHHLLHEDIAGRHHGVLGGATRQELPVQDHLEEYLDAARTEAIDEYANKRITQVTLPVRVLNYIRVFFGLLLVLHGVGVEEGDGEVLGDHPEGSVNGDQVFAGVVQLLDDAKVDSDANDAEDAENDKDNAKGIVNSLAMTLSFKFISLTYWN